MTGGLAALLVALLPCGKYLADGVRPVREVPPAWQTELNHGEVSVPVVLLGRLRCSAL